MCDRKFELNVFNLWIVVTFIFVHSLDTAIHPFTHILCKTMTAPQDDKFYIIQRVKALTAQLQEILNVSMRKFIPSKYFNSSWFTNANCTLSCVEYYKNCCSSYSYWKFNRLGFIVRSHSLSSFYFFVSKLSEYWSNFAYSIESTLIRQIHLVSTNV